MASPLPPSPLLLLRSSAPGWVRGLVFGVWAGWLAGWQAGWLAGWLVGWSVGRPAGWLAGGRRGVTTKNLVCPLFSSWRAFCVTTNCAH